MAKATTSSRQSSTHGSASSTSFSQYSGSHGSSLISSITMDDALLPSSSSSSDLQQQQQHRPLHHQHHTHHFRLKRSKNNRLELLNTPKWAGNPDLEEELGDDDEEGSYISALLRATTASNWKRFSDVTEGTDTALCEKPERLPSLGSLYCKSASSSISDYKSSKSFQEPNFFLSEETLDIPNDDDDDDGGCGNRIDNQDDDDDDDKKGKRKDNDDLVDRLEKAMRLVN